MLAPEEFRFFLDSGAYTAWTKNIHIDLDEYCAFIKANSEKLEAYACLDVIPGKPGGFATLAQKVAAAEESWTNYLYMRNEGLDPIPVFHYGEPWHFLERMLRYGCTYIGVGGLVAVQPKERRAWLDEFFTRICDKNGFPTVKTHGFGMTALVLMFRYPWHSVDSTKWLQTAAYGEIFLPQTGPAGFVFDQVPSTIAISAKHEKSIEGRPQADALPRATRATLDKWLTFCGTTYEGCRTHHHDRALVNITFFREVSLVKMSRAFQPYSFGGQQMRLL